MAERAVAAQGSEPPVARACWLGRRGYAALHELQQRLVRERSAGRVGDCVLLLEHEPVITLGRNAKAAHVLASEQVLSSRGIALVQTERGGDVTLHAPGQLVGYPIVDLKPGRCDVRRYVRSLAEVMIRLAARHGVEAGTVDGLIGVWADSRAPSRWRGLDPSAVAAKIGAIGVRMTDWVTMHGFALNLSIDLDVYRWIVPCGIAAHPVASIESLTGLAPQTASVALSSASVLSECLGVAVPQVEDLSGETDLETALLQGPRAAVSSPDG